jgi:Sulfotransferase domain
VVEVSEVSIPGIDRSIPPFGRFMMSVIVYGIAVPLNWVLMRLGLGAGLISLMRRMRPKDRWTKVFAGYEPTEHDVFVSTFAKSGTNWMMQIAHQIAFRGAGEYENVHDVVSWPDMNRGRRQMSVALDDTNVWRAAPTGLRVIKTHVAAFHVPYSEKARYLIVVRDPKDILVSSYFFAGGAAGPLMPSPDVWFELFVTGRFPLDFGATWAEHTASYWALRDRANVLLLSFREMKRDLGAAVRRVAELLDVELTATELERVIERSSFDYMKGIDERFSPVEPGALPWAGGFTMMRQGKTGVSGEMLTTAQQARIDAHFQDELARLGSDFPYADFFDVTPAEAAAAAA